MAEESFQNPDGSSTPHHQDEAEKEQTPEKHPNDGVSRGEHKGRRWTDWLLIALMVLLFGSSVATLVVSHQAYESSRKQVIAIEQLNQSIKDIQRSIVNLSNMLEQTPAEEEEPEDDKGGGPTGDGSI